MTCRQKKDLNSMRFKTQEQSYSITRNKRENRWQRKRETKREKIRERELKKEKKN